MKIPHPLTGNLAPIQSVLRSLAAQENCDGSPYDQMMLASHYIDMLEKKVSLDKNQIAHLVEQLNTNESNKIDI